MSRVRRISNVLWVVCREKGWNTSAERQRLGSASFKGDSGTDVREEHKMQEECSSVATQGDLVLTEKACRW
jgi:hypothetical protein